MSSEQVNMFPNPNELELDYNEILETIMDGKKFFVPGEEFTQVSVLKKILNNLNVKKSNDKKLQEAFGNSYASMVIRADVDFGAKYNLGVGCMIYVEKPIDRIVKLTGFIVE